MDHGLNERNLPIEYKLLDYKPEPWTTLKCALLLKYMTYDLAGHSDDFYVTNILKKYGQEAIDSLFINDPYFHDPIIPPGTTWDFSPLPSGCTR
jgi:penicillin amidase